MSALISDAVVPDDGLTNVRTAWSSLFQDLQVWTDLADAIDEVFAVNIQQPLDLMLLIRTAVQYSAKLIDDAIYATGEDTYSGHLLDADERLMYERSVLVMTANMLGFTYLSPSVSIAEDVVSVIEDDDYFRINAFVAQYYPEKGTEQFVNFWGFASNTLFAVETLWADGALLSTAAYGNYGNMFPGGNESPGNDSITNPGGGKEFPTTHVNAFYDVVKYGGLPLEIIRQLSVHLAPINLVFKNIIQRIISTPSINGLAMVGKIHVNYGNPEDISYIRLVLVGTTKVVDKTRENDADVILARVLSNQSVRVLDDGNYRTLTLP